MMPRRAMRLLILVPLLLGALPSLALGADAASSDIWLQRIAAIGTMLVAVLGALGTLFGIWMNRMGAKVEQIHLATNSIVNQRVAAAEKVGQVAEQDAARGREQALAVTSAAGDAAAAAAAAKIVTADLADVRNELRRLAALLEATARPAPVAPTPP